MASSTLLKTPLYELHKELGAKIVSFAGYELPIQYSLGIIKEHLHTRDHVGLFDVSHMGQIIIEGKNAAQQLENLIPIDFELLNNGQQSYGLITNKSGGVIDDLMITRLSCDKILLVVNAATKLTDMEYLKLHLHNLDIYFLEDHALLALQGPEAKTVIEKLIPECAKLKFMHSLEINYLGVKCLVSRSGYTGEDGFEISIPSSQSETLGRNILSFEKAEAIGLGARDTLRLEAGLCLYGHDLNQTTTPVEAGLAWCIGKSRRPGGNKAGGFTGDQIIIKQLKEGALKYRVGLKVDGQGLIREGAEVFDEQGNLVGCASSGSFSPSLDSAIAMAYVESHCSKLGGKLFANVRGKAIPMTIVNLPFVKNRYCRE